MVKKVKASKSPLLKIFALIFAVVVIASLYAATKPAKTDFPTVNQEMGSIIKGFPNFPMYPNAKVETSQITGAYTDQPISYQAYLETTDNVNKVISWYLEATRNEGWIIDRPLDTSQVDDQNFIVKKDDLKATINVEQEDSSSFITIYIQ